MYEAVVANIEERACTAQLEVPINDPVNEPVAINVKPSYVSVGTPPKTPPLLYWISPELPSGRVDSPPFKANKA